MALQNNSKYKAHSVLFIISLIILSIFLTSCSDDTTYTWVTCSSCGGDGQGSLDQRTGKWTKCILCRGSGRISKSETKSNATTKPLPTIDFEAIREKEKYFQVDTSHSLEVESMGSYGDFIWIHGWVGGKEYQDENSSYGDAISSSKSLYKIVKDDIEYTDFEDLLELAELITPDTLYYSEYADLPKIAKNGRITLFLDKTTTFD